MVKKKKNLVSVLKKLVISLGGSAESDNAVDLVDEFADITAEDANTPKLPVATAEDAGKVPTVQKNGSYALAEAGGGAKVFVGYVDGIGRDGRVYKDKGRTQTYGSFNEAYNAIKDADVIKLVTPESIKVGNSTIYPNRTNMRNDPGESTYVCLYHYYAIGNKEVTYTMFE